MDAITIIDASIPSQANQLMLKAKGMTFYTQADQTYRITKRIQVQPL